MKTQNEMRSEFEKLKNIKRILLKGVFSYSGYTGNYEFIDAMVCINAAPSQRKDHGYLNGAWYAFKEKQKKVDEAISYLEKNEGYMKNVTIKKMLELLK